MVSKHKLLSISLVASTLLGGGLFAGEEKKVPENQPATNVVQVTPPVERVLTIQQQEIMLKRLADLRRQMARSCKAEILKMERMEARKLAQADKAYALAVQRANRATARGKLSEADAVVLGANVEHARKNAHLYEQTIDGTIQKQAEQIQKRYDLKLKEINLMIQDVEKGIMPRIHSLKLNRKVSLRAEHPVRMMAQKER